MTLLLLPLVADANATSSESSTAMVASLVGLGGVLVGAVLGLFGTLITTSRQIDRQERNARRAVYSSFLEAAMTATYLLDDQRRAFVEANAAADLYYQFLEEIQDPANAGSVEYIRLQANKHWDRSQAARTALEGLEGEFRPVWHAFTSQGHKLKIHAPTSVHEAAMHVYSSVGIGTSFDREPDPALGRLRSRALRCFSALARADSRSPNAPSLARVERAQRAELLALDAECRRLEKVMHWETDPEMLRPLITEEELDMP